MEYLTRLVWFCEWNNKQWFCQKGFFPESSNIGRSSQSGFPWSAQEGWSTIRLRWKLPRSSPITHHAPSQPMHATQHTEMLVKVVIGNGWTVQNLSECHKSGDRSGRVKRYLCVSTAIKVRHNTGLLKADMGQSSPSARDRQNGAIYLCVH